MDKNVMNITCIACPRGCALTVTKTAEGRSVSGNVCKRGEAYGIAEAEHPVRTLTTSVWLAGGAERVVSCKSEQPIPKAAIPACLAQLAELTVTAPVAMGEVILADAAGTGVNIVATRSVAEA